MTYSGENFIEDLIYVNKDVHNFYLGEPSKKINSDLVDSGILTSSDQYKFNEHSSIASLQQDAKSIQSIVGISSNDSMKSLHNSSQQSLIFKRRNISAKQNKEFLIKAHSKN